MGGGLNSICNDRKGPSLWSNFDHRKLEYKILLLRQPLWKLVEKLVDKCSTHFAGVNTKNVLKPTPRGSIIPLWPEQPRAPFFTAQALPNVKITFPEQLLLNWLNLNSRKKNSKGVYIYICIYNGPKELPKMYYGFFNHRLHDGTLLVLKMELFDPKKAYECFFPPVN